MEGDVYIRWIVRGHKSAHANDMTFHDAYLVSSYRNEQGQPRQQIISYLGTIREMAGGLPAIERALFLIRAEQALHQVSELSAQERRHILSQLHQRVPPLTEAEMRVGFRNTLQWYQSWWHEQGQAPSEDEMVDMVRQVSAAAAAW